MNYQPPQAVELTDDESKLNEQIPDSPHSSGNWTQIADAMESLFKSLTKRKAIPEIRLRIFSDPKYAETRNKSPKQIFESNGTCGKRYTGTHTSSNTCAILSMVPIYRRP